MTLSSFDLQKNYTVVNNVKIKRTSNNKQRFRLKKPNVSNSIKLTLKKKPKEDITDDI